MDTSTPPVAYSVLITFRDGRTYEKCGLSWFDAVNFENPLPHLGTPGGEGSAR